MNHRNWIVSIFILFFFSSCATDRHPEGRIPESSKIETPSHPASSTPSQPVSGTPIQPVSSKRTANVLALLVGINKYKHFPNLRGAVNDVENIKRLLVEKFDFPDDGVHIKILTDEKATRKAILEGIENHLIAQADPDTIVVFHYSGHGSKVLDTTGDELDGYDETIVPYDSGREPNPNEDITDDELKALLNKITQKTAYVTFIMDSCHSGSAVRSSGLARTVEADDRLLPERNPDLTRVTRGGVEGSSDLPLGGSRYVLISGAKAEEFSYEYKVNGQSYGAMTWYLAEQIRAADANASYRDVMEIVKNQVNAEYPTQHPQLEGTGVDQQIFGARGEPPASYVLATPQGENSVTLHAGQVHGATVGSQFDVYPPGTKVFAEADPVAKIEVAKVNITSATASLVSGEGIEAASRAVESSHYYPDVVLKVFFKDITGSLVLQKIKKELSNFKHITIILQDRGYDLLLRETGGFILIEGKDPTEISPRVAVTESNAVEHVVDQVAQWAKWFNVRSINNTNPTLNITFEIDAPGLGTVFAEGTEFDIIVKNGSGKKLYLTLLDLSSDGSIDIVFPEFGQEEFIAPGNTWRTRLQTVLPSGRDSVRDILKLVATTTPTSYSFMKQPPVRGGSPLPKTRGRNRNPLEELLANAAVGTTRGVKLVTVGNWVTEERMIEVRR